MMKKMKGVALDASSPYCGVYGDAKAMLKHQTLLQDYHDLQQDVEASRNKLENMKQRKVTLLAEVRFLRQRYKYLLKSKHLNLRHERGKELVQPPYLENQRKTNMKVPIASKKEATLHNLLPPVLKLNQKGRVYMGKEASVQNKIQSFSPNHKEKHQTGKNAARVYPTTISNLNPGGRLYKGKKVAHQSPIPVIDLHHQERIYNANGATMRKLAPMSDLPSMLSRAPAPAPVFDLNHISQEEEELEDNCELSRFEERKKGLINEEELSDLKLSVCRNVGDGSNRARKRKISWQDPVALRV